MKYLLSYLEALPNAPRVEEPGFQQLLTDVQAGKSQARSSEQFYESLEKIVNELRSSPESAAFQKPVSKRDAPDYHLYISKPMDLSTVLRNVKSRKYKNKADFAADLDLIWENCHTYNTQDIHPLRAAARFMQQKTNHHLEFLVDKTDRAPVARVVSRPSNVSTPRLSGPSGSSLLAGGSPNKDSPAAFGEDNDAPGESDEERLTDGGGASQSRAGPSKPRTGSQEAVTDGIRANGLETMIIRPKLQTSLDQTPALYRTASSMTRLSSLSLSCANPSSADKGKAKEILYGIPPPPWYPVTSADDEEGRLQGSWWSVMARDEAYTAGLPSVPTMAPGCSRRRKRIPRDKNGNAPHDLHASPPPPDQPPSLVHSKPKSLGKVIHKTIEQLHEARKLSGMILEWQRIDAEGGIQPPPAISEVEEKIREEQERNERKRDRIAEKEEIAKRRKLGGELGEEEAAKEMKKASASLLALSGFEGANEIALDMFTRVAIDNMRSLGRTFRLLLDDFAQQMTPEEIVLHALNENGQVRPHHLETYIKDDIEKTSIKVSEMTRKVKQAHKEVTTAPVIEDDMMFNENGEMLLDGNFAEELGEDFLGLRDLGIDKEFGMSSLSVPSSLFYGRRKRGVDSALNGSKVDVPDYPPPPPFVPLTQSNYISQLPSILHSFFSSRLNGEKGLQDDGEFDPARAQIGPLGQIISKNPVTVPGPRKKEVKENGDALVREKKLSVKKVVQPGVGKGNWIRPSKEERERKAAEKRAALEAMNATKLGLGGQVEEDDGEGDPE